MRKTFSFSAPNKKPERQVDSIKHEIKKYLARERRKKIPENADYWGFNCKIGPNENSTTKVESHEINSWISKLFSDKNESFYVEILAKPCRKPKSKKHIKKT